MSEYQLAQINIARIKGVNMEDPVMKEFRDNLDYVNGVAEGSPGFVWRLKDESNNATSINPYNDEQIIINISVWESIEELEQFMYKTVHADFLRRRREWFQKFGKVYMAMWWIRRGKFPTEAEAVAKLDELQRNGSSESVFGFRDKYARPDFRLR